MRAPCPAAGRDLERHGAVVERLHDPDAGPSRPTPPAARRSRSSSTSASAMPRAPACTTRGRRVGRRLSGDPQRRPRRAAPRPPSSRPAPSRSRAADDVGGQRASPTMVDPPAAVGVRRRRRPARRRAGGEDDEATRLMGLDRRSMSLVRPMKKSTSISAMPTTETRSNTTREIGRPPRTFSSQREHDVPAVERQERQQVEDRERQRDERQHAGERALLHGLRRPGRRCRPASTAGRGSRRDVTTEPSVGDRLPRDPPMVRTAFSTRLERA